MLSDLELVSKLFRDEPASGFHFDEVNFDDEAKSTFAKMPIELNFYDHSARIKISDTTDAYLPSHYFLYALKIRPLAVMLKNYLGLKDDIVNSLTGNAAAKAKSLDKMANSTPPTIPTAIKIDQYSQDNFFSILQGPKKRLGAKNLVNVTNGVIRSNKDFFASVILKALPVPDASSSALGHLIYEFAQNPTIYEVLSKKYSHKLPYLLSSKSGDELLYSIFVTLGLEGKLDLAFNTLTGSPRNEKFGSIPDVFLFNATPVPGNSLYFDTPIHYSEQLGQYVFFKKDLLGDPATLDEVSRQVSTHWGHAYVDHTDSMYYLKPKLPSQSPRIKGGVNRIIYGAPGTGKSHSINEEIKKKGAKKRTTVFHQDTQYSDFVGSLKPHTQRGVDDKPTISYQFRPGPFVNALVEALNCPSEAVYLVIEEINRAAAAAVFGELFQLLDRKDAGESSYGIEAGDPDMLEYIEGKIGRKLSELKLPSNLWIVATMNSSDQAVMPLDTAFKRRWSFEYCSLNFKDAPAKQLELMTSDGIFEISWADFADKVINQLLKEFGVTEDRLVGPFFLTSNDLKDWKSALNEKLFVYLWDDVLRHKIQDRKRLFAPTIGTFGELFDRFKDNKSTQTVFGSQAEDLIKNSGTKSTDPNA